MGFDSTFYRDSTTILEYRITLPSDSMVRGTSWYSVVRYVLVEVLLTWLINGRLAELMLYYVSWVSSCAFRGLALMSLCLFVYLLHPPSSAPRPQPQHNNMMVRSGPYYLLR
jgi:hypothetical protein